MKLIRITPFAVSALITVWPGMAAADVQVGGDIVVEAGKTMESAVSFGGNVTVRGTVSDAAVAIGGNVAVESGGQVLGDAVSVGGNISVRDSAEVRGDAVVVGGELLVAPSGAVGGERVRFGNIGGRMFSNAGKRIPRMILLGPFSGVFRGIGAAFLFFFIVMRMLIWIAVAVLAYHFFPENVGNMAEHLRLRFWSSLFFGILILLLIPFLFLFLLVSLIGIPLIPAALLTLFIIYLFGAAGVALWAGKLLPNQASRSGMKNVILGVLGISLLRVIPGFGLLMWLFLGSASLGVAVISRLGAGPRVAPAP